MITFLVGIALLLCGGYLYSHFTECVFQPDDRHTPAQLRADGIDFTAMPRWKNAIINLLSITGIGVILGAIQAVLFGPAAFIFIPLGNIFAGAVHNYFSGMIAMRNRGFQMPRLLEKYLGAGVSRLYQIILLFTLFLSGIVLLYTPGDYIASVLPKTLPVPQPLLFALVYGALLLYLIITTLFPIDRTIGRIYPMLSIVLFVSTAILFIGILRHGKGYLPEFWQSAPRSTVLMEQQPLIPVLFITVTGGILSGLHGTQATLLSRTIRKESEGRMVFFYTMLWEGLLAMCWAAAAMIVLAQHPAITRVSDPLPMLALIAKEFMGDFGPLFAFLVLVIFPLTTGDTLFRGIRLIIAENFHVNQRRPWKRFLTTACVFVPAILMLLIAKLQPSGFNRLWRYYGFLSQLLAAFGLAMISVYLHAHYKNYWMSFLPMLASSFVACSYILHAQSGLHLDALLGAPNSYCASNAVAVCLSAAFGLLVWRHAVRKAHDIRIRDDFHL